MEIKIGEYHLDSKDPQRLFNFFSFLFDIEPIESIDDILFELGGMVFRIKSFNKKRLNKKMDLVFHVGSESELQDLFHSIEFYHYKEKMAGHSTKLEGQSVRFEDFDGRIWTFKLESRQYIPVSEGMETQSLN